MAIQAHHKIGILIVVTVFLLIGGWRLLVIAHQHSRLMDIATEIGSIADPKEEQFNRELIPNNSGTAVVYFQETETGIGTYFCSVADDKPKLLFEQGEKSYNHECAMLGWSPDDDAFAYFCQLSADPDRPQRQIVVYSGTTGETILKLPGDNFIWCSRFVMLSAHAFVYSSINQILILVSQNPDGTWSQRPFRTKQFFPKPVPDGEMNNFAATSAHSIAWQQQGEIWTYDFESGVCDKIWESSTNQLQYFSYDENTRNYQLICDDQNGQVNVLFHPSEKGFPNSEVVKITPYERASYADLHENNGVYAFSIKADAHSDPVEFTWPGMIEYYVLSADRLFFTGNPADGPPGVWEYDLKSKTATCLASGLLHDFIYAKLIAPDAGMGTNSAGKSFNYHLWSPPHIMAGKKYPLIIGQTHYMWFSYPQIAVSAGYYYAAADRISWFDGLADWPSDVKALFEILAKNPNIDTNRILFFATSAESSYLAVLMEEDPTLAQGAILFDPTGLPHLSNTSVSKMLIMGGKVDGDGAPIHVLTTYQDEAARLGIPMKLILQNGVQHISRSVATERERARLVAQFLSENE